jgi:hypothetical protein
LTVPRAMTAGSLAAPSAVDGTPPQRHPHQPAPRPGLPPSPDGWRIGSRSANRHRLRQERGWSEQWRPSRPMNRRSDPIRTGMGLIHAARTTANRRLRWSVRVWSPPPESNRRPHPYHRCSGEFTTPCRTSRAHTTGLMRGAVEGRVVRRREGTRSAVSGKFLARGLHGRPWHGRQRHPSRAVLTTNGDLGVGLRHPDRS